MSTTLASFAVIGPDRQIPIPIQVIEMAPDDAGVLAAPVQYLDHYLRRAVRLPTKLEIWANLLNVRCLVDTQVAEES